MGRRGPLPDPSSERSATGRNTLSKKKPEPPPEPGAVVAPDHVTARPLAAAFWRIHAPTLAAEGRLRQIHAETFATLCLLYADTRDLADQLAAEGWITATDKGQSISPVVKALRDSRRDYITLAAKFGLTAADEARLPTSIEADNGEEDDEEAALRKFTG